MSKIEWTDETWNPVTGCTKISPGCTNCYAERMARRLAGRHGYPKAPHHFDVTLHPDRLDQPLKWKKPRRVFVCSMSDLFHEDVSPDFRYKLWLMMLQNSKHTFQVLTKRAVVMQRWVYNFQGGPSWPSSYLPPNIWLGVTAEDQKRADERIPCLLQTPAAVRFVSVEPMLGPVDLRQYLGCSFCGNHGIIGYSADSSEDCPECGGDAFYKTLDNEFLSQVIIGCESGPRRRPMKLEWAIELVRQCQAANVACFVKQLPINGRVSHDPAEWPEELRVREYPE